MSKKLDRLLDFWAENNMNVILEGPHGFGKTAMVKAAFDRKGWKHKYFSASTMDPWVDLVGVPREHTDENGNTYLNLVRPKEFQNDEYDAIFFDEFNRAPSKVRNAVMELIQFKSVNGYEFKNLKVVWVAINPHDEEGTYDVDKVDPAQMDRFHVHYVVPAVPDVDFFTEKYGKENAISAIEWWDALPEKIKEQVSARRLEYALDCFLNGGDIKYVLPAGSNPSKLLMTLKAGSAVERIKTLIENKDEAGIVDFMKLDNNFEVVVNLVKYEPNLVKSLVPLMEEERLMRLVSENEKVRDYVMDPDNIETYRDMVNAVLSAGGLSERDAMRLKTLLARNNDDKSPTGAGVFIVNPESATELPDDAMRIIEDYAECAPSASIEELEKMYNFLLLNMPTKTNDIGEVIDIFLILFCIINKANSKTFFYTFPEFIPMLNYSTLKCQSHGRDVTETWFKKHFALKNLNLNITKIQGFLDTYHESLVKKPRLF